MLLPPSDRGRYLAMYMAIEMQIKMRYYWHITGLAKVLKFDDTQYDLKECKLVNNLVIPIKITFDQVISLLEAYCRTSLVVQWLRIHLPMQDTRVSFLFWKDSTCVGVNKPVDHNYWSWCALEPVFHNKRSLHAAIESESEVAQSCLTLCDPMDCSLPGSSLHGILQVRVLEWVAISFSRGSSQPRDQTQVSCIPGRRFNLWATREACNWRLPPTCQN